MIEMGQRRLLLDQSSGSGQTLATLRHPYLTDPISSKRVCFYKSGDPQFNGLRMVINRRTFKTFDALLDSLSKKVPLPFGVRNITTPRGVHAVRTLEELQDGKSYICSDSRKVKPIDLALASRKPPPWYHARPVSARRRAAQLARQHPGRAAHRQPRSATAVRTPKRIMVFHNGDPSIRHTVMLQKKTTPTFQALLDYVSQLMQFHVVKLHTPDGRRVDGLPALILCSGCVVAAGREPFKSANYNAQKSPPPTWLPTNRPRRLKRNNRKKKSLTGLFKSRHFSPSSERYFVNQIHNSIAGSFYDLPSNPADSVELETSHRFAAETEGDPEEGARGRDTCLATDDDIEKSFRVNQDGSMTVEMRVRLTIKEEEAIRWTTTLSRSFVQLDAEYLPDPEPVLEQENSSPESNPLGWQDSAVSVDAVDRAHSRDDEDPPPMDNGIPSEDGNEEETVKSQTDEVSPRRAPTPGPRTSGEKQLSEESVRMAADEEIQEDTVDSYSYREQREDGAVIEESCMIKQSSVKPVPKPRRVNSVDGKPRRVNSVDVKPRRFNSVDINSRNNLNQPTFKSPGVAEILQIEDRGAKSTEAVLHIYEQQTCRDVFLANGQYCERGVSTYGLLYGRPATSDTARFSSANDFETGNLGRPSTASESIGIWRTDNTSLKSDLTAPSPASKNGATHVQKQQPQKDSLGLLSQSSQENSQPRAVVKAKRTSSKPKVVRKYVRRTMSPGKRRKEGKAGSAETFSSAALLRRVYGFKPKPKNKQKQKPQGHDGAEAVNTERSGLPSDTIQCVIKDPNILSSLRENKSIQVSFKNNMLDVSPAEVSQPRGTLKRQPSMHQERKDERGSDDVNDNMPLPALNSSSSVINEYVEHWLEKSHYDSTADPDGEAPQMEAATQGGVSEVSDVNRGVIAAAGEAPSPADHPSEKMNVPSMETSLSRNPSAKRARLVSNLSFERKMSLRKASLDKSASTSDPALENTKSSTPIKIAVENTSLSSDKTQRSTENTPDSSPSHHTSASPTSLASEERASSASTLSDEAPSPTVISSSRKESKTQSHLPHNQAASPKLPLKKTKLISNLSLEKKLSIRKASSENSEFPNDPPLENTQVSSRPSTDGKPLQRNQSLKSASSRNPSPDKNPSPNLSLKSASSQNPSPDKNPSPNLSLKSASSRNASPDKNPSPNLSLKSASSRNPSPDKNPSPNQSLKSASSRNTSPDKNPSPNQSLKSASSGNTSPDKNTRKAALRNRLSPYSQSLEVVSPPMKHKSRKKSLSNLPIDSTPEPANLAPKGTPSERNGHQAALPKPKATLRDSSPDKTLPPATLTPLNDVMNDIKPVLEKLCYSIKSIRQVTQNQPASQNQQVTQNQHPSNSLPDFSSHVASTFGSSSKALLAFLSVMTLKGGRTSLNIHEMNANHVVCAEAWRMIDSLREIASMEDKDRVKASLSDLQQSTSVQLLQCWKGFQELSDKCKSRSPTSNPPEKEVVFEACSEGDCGIDEFINELDMPDTLKEELAALPVSKRTDSGYEGEMATRITEQAELSPEDKVNVNLPLPLKEEAVGVNELNQPDHSNEISLPLAVEKQVKQQNLSGDQREVHIEESTKEGEEGEVMKEEQECHIEDKPSQERTDNQYMYVKVCTEECMSSVEEDRCSVHEEQSDMECNKESMSIREGEEEKNKPSANKNVEQKMSSEKSMSTHEEEQLDAESEDLQREQDEDYGSDSNKVEEDEKTSTKNSMGLNISIEESTSSPDVAERCSSEEERREVKRKELQAISEESVSSIEEDQGGLEEQQEDYTEGHEEEIKKELQSSSEKREDSPKIILEDEEEHYVFDVDEQASKELEESYTGYQASCGKGSPTEEDTNCETVVEQPRCRSVQQIKQSVAERISLLQKQVAVAQQKIWRESGDIRQSPQNDVPSDAEDPTPGRHTPRSPQSATSVPQSSLSFSYDSNDIITKEPEGYRVKSIKEMFLAKSVSDIQYGQRQLSPNTSDLSDYTPETPDSGGYQSRTSSELSGAEDSSAQKAISKGIVRRTIERLYGKNDANVKEPETQIPPSAPKPKNKESSAIFPPFHIARTKVTSDWSYLNAANTKDTYREPTRCIAFNAQVGPGDGVPIDEGRWLLKENTLIRKSISDPVGINKSGDQGGMSEDTTEDVPYSLFSTRSEGREDKVTASKCTYFSLPHAKSESDDLNTLSKSSLEEPSAERNEQSEETKTWAERNGILPSIPTDFRMLDNKVHPLVDSQVVVAQPQKGHGVVSRRQEPDALEMLYTFCGQHCPIL